MFSSLLLLVKSVLSEHCMDESRKRGAPYSPGKVRAYQGFMAGIRRAGHPCDAAETNILHENIVLGFAPTHNPGMAFRIHDSVVRGEIDNRVMGTVSGKIWVEGRAEPVVLKLKGNAWP